MYVCVYILPSSEIKICLAIAYIFYEIFFFGLKLCITIGLVDWDYQKVNKDVSIYKVFYRRIIYYCLYVETIYYLELECILYKLVCSLRAGLCNLNFLNCKLGFSLLWIYSMASWKYNIFLLWLYFTSYRFFIFVFYGPWVAWSSKFDVVRECFKFFGCHLRFAIFLTSKIFIFTNPSARAGYDTRSIF